MFFKLNQIICILLIIILCIIVYFKFLNKCEGYQNNCSSDNLTLVFNTPEGEYPLTVISELKYP